MLWPLLLLAAQPGRAEPNTKACCAAAGVSAYCTEQFCDVARPPNYFAVFEIAARCPRFLGLIAGCLADGRDHAPCCRRSFRDDLSCLHLCNGSAPAVNTSQWGNAAARYRHGSAYGLYVSCLSFNIKSMFTCMREGYASTPGPPSDLLVSAVTQDSAQVAWHPPGTLAEQVRDYAVYYRKLAGFTRTQEMLSSTATSLALQDLSPDTKYEVFVRARAGDGLSSLQSDSVVFVTTGVAPRVAPRQEEVDAAMSAPVTIVCMVEVFGSQHISDVALSWRKFADGSYRPLDLTRRTGTTRKFTTVSYPRHISPDGKNTFLMALKVGAFEQEDVGSYRCEASNRFGQDSASISVRQAGVPDVPPRPRNITACCVAENAHYGCPGVCGHGAKPEGARPDFKCTIADIKIRLKCSTEGLDYKPCCMRERVPDRCLPFCDGSMEFSSDASIFHCALHSSSIVACHAEALTGLPDPPHGVALEALTKDSLHVSWGRVSGADRYVVYLRRTGRPGPWRHVASAELAVTVEALEHGASYDVLVLAANRAGFSDNSTPMYIDLGRNQAFYARL